MFVTESAADTVLLATDDVPVRALVSRGLRTAGFLVIEATSGTALELLRAYSGALEWLIVDTKPGYTCLGLHAALEYRYLNPLRPVVCLVDGESHPVVLRLPDVIAVRRPVRDARQVIDAMQVCRLTVSEDLIEV